MPLESEAWIGQLNDGRVFGHWEAAPRKHSGWKRGWRCFPYKCNGNAASTGIVCPCYMYFEAITKRKVALGFVEEEPKEPPLEQRLRSTKHPRFEVLGSEDGLSLRIRRPGLQQRHRLSPDEADALGLDLIRKADASRAIADIMRVSGKRR